MAFGFLNHFDTRLGAALGGAAGDTTLTLLAGQAVAMADASAQKQYALTLTERDIRGRDIRREIVYVTGRSADNLTVVRAREDTARQAWPTGTRVQARLTAGMMGNAVQQGDPVLDHPPPAPLVEGLSAAAQVNIVSGPLDLTDATASVTLTMPAGHLLFLDDLDLVVTGADAAGGAPEVSAGTSGDPAAFLAASAVTVSAPGARQGWSVAVASGTGEVTVSVAVAGTGTTYQARAVLRGYLLEL